MSTISSVQNYGSPLSRLQAQLGTEIQAGSVKESDSDALTTALSSIDSEFQQDRARNTSATDTSATSTTSTRRDPASFKAKLDDLIAGQVSSGSLTSDQADELKTVFAAAAPEGGPDAAGGIQRPGGPAGAGGPPPAPPSDGIGGSQASQAQDTTDTDRDTLLKQFVEQLRQSVSSSYSAGGAATRSARPLVFDISA